MHMHKSPLPALLLVVMLLPGCGGNIGAGIPLVNALSECSLAPQASRMLPADVDQAAFHTAFSIDEIRVSGPTASRIPPPILAATFKQALTQAVRASGARTHAPNPVYTLVADIVSQQHQGTFSTTRLELVVHYALYVSSDPGTPLWESRIETTGSIDDWHVNACERLRRLQESLSRDNIRQLMDGIKGVGS